MKFHNLLVIALIIIRRTHKAHKIDRGAENPTGPNKTIAAGIVKVCVLYVCQQSLVLCCVRDKIV